MRDQAMFHSSLLDAFPWANAFKQQCEDETSPGTTLSTCMCTEGRCQILLKPRAIANPGTGWTPIFCD